MNAIGPAAEGTSGSLEAVTSKLLEIPGGTTGGIGAINNLISRINAIPNRSVSISATYNGTPLDGNKTVTLTVKA